MGSATSPRAFFKVPVPEPATPAQMETPQISPEASRSATLNGSSARARGPVQKTPRISSEASRPGAVVKRFGGARPEGVAGRLTDGWDGSFQGVWGQASRARPQDAPGGLRDALESIVKGSADRARGPDQKTPQTRSETSRRAFSGDPGPGLADPTKRRLRHAQRRLREHFGGVRRQSSRTRPKDVPGCPIEDVPVGIFQGARSQSSRTRP